MLSGAEPARSEVVISNLTFVSTILECVIDSRIADHANRFGLVSPVQSAYRKHHSTVTALVKIHNDLVGILTEVKWLTFPQPSIQ